MSFISEVKAREILDSRGNPTVEVEVSLTSGITARSAVPSGASTGKYEAVEIRDGEQGRYRGKGVLKAVQNVHEIIFPRIKGLEVVNQGEIDHRLIEADGTPNKSKLGANATLGVSLACARAAALDLQIPLHRYLGGPWSNVLPLPMANILNGGGHADGNVDLQEFMVVPTHASSLREAVRWTSEIFHELKEILSKKGYATSVGDEGGYAPSLRDNEEAIDLILEAVQKVGYENQVRIAIDAAASELAHQANKEDQYCFWKSNKRVLSSDRMVDFWTTLIKKYPQIISIEDPMGEDDWSGWSNLTESLRGQPIQIVGDDLFVTNSAFLEKGIEQKVANAILIKVNQIGTLSETIEVIQLAQKNGYGTIISHRSGETEDTIIADLAVATRAGQIKTGSVCRSERVAKYNQLIRLEENIGDQGIFDFKHSLPNLG